MWLGGETKKGETPGSTDHTVIERVEGEEGAENTPARPQLKPPYLVIVEGPRTGARFPLSDGPNIIGRAQGNAIRLEDQSVSRQHSEIAKTESGWQIRDLGSKNGTSVNGAPLSEAVVIGHRDVIKAGIYQLRLILESTSLEDEMSLPQELLVPNRTIFVAAPPDSLTSEMRKTALPPEPPQEEPREKAPPPVDKEVKELEYEEEGRKSKLSNKRLMLLGGALAVVVVAAAAYLFSELIFKKPQKKRQVAQSPSAEVAQLPAIDESVAPSQVPPPPSVPPPVEGQAQVGAQAPPTQIPADAQGTKPVVPEPAFPQVAEVKPPLQLVPVFLDIKSSPMPAKIQFQGKELGQGDVRVNVELEPGKTYRAQAVFTMPEIAQSYTQQVEFTVEKDKPIIPIFFRGPIGTLKVMDLPRDVQFYLEGKFSYDKFQEQTAKLNEIVLQKPIYIPYGKYVVELRRSKQLGVSSQTFVADIIFHRDFVIAEDSPVYQIEVKEQDLGVFPVTIRSDPGAADVFIDGKMVGKTPYDGIFPLGEHKLSLRKEGFFEHSEDLKVDINTSFVADVKLKTSVAGAHINNARLAINRAMYQEAVNELAEALNSGPAPSEVALANYLLGVCFLRTNDLERAIAYFEQARTHESQRYPAMLGLANCYAIAQRMDQALPLLVEVLLKVTDEQTKREAHDLFQKISPFKSVMYVYSDPSGAQVIVNDKAIAQTTPVILHELPLGNYRLRIEKPGFLPTDLNLSLSVNEFNPVIVKLKPIPQ